MVVGDPHQLAHITSLGAGVDDALAKKHGLDDDTHAAFGYRDTSLYDLAARHVAGEPIFLNRHFRSHPTVVAFSNEMFYASRLVVETDPARFLPGQPFRWFDVAGKYEPGPSGRSARNPVEAQAVVDVLDVVLREDWAAGRSVGVVTPFAPQRELLRSLIEARFPTEQITVDTADGFQGDERDIMIFSPTVTAGAPAGTVRFAANANLLNVTLTRWAKMIVVGDLEFARARPARCSPTWRRTRRPCPRRPSLGDGAAATFCVTLRVAACRPRGRPSTPRVRSS